jgi:hypothetical protein
MAAALWRLRSLWLVCLLVLTPAGPLTLAFTGHGPGDDAHPAAVVHDAADHGISAGALPDSAPEPHCLYCQSASSHRFGWIEAPGALHAPAAIVVDWPATDADSLRTRLRHALPARAPPRAA